MVASSSKHDMLRQDVAKAMKGVGVEMNDNLLTKCVTVAGNFQLTGKVMAEMWEAHSLNKGVDELNETTFSGYRHFLAVENKPKGSVKRTLSPSAVVSPPPTDNKRMNLGKNLFADRSNVGQVVATYNPHQSKEWKKDDNDNGETSIEVMSGLLEPVRYMNTPIEKAAQALEDQSQDMQSQMDIDDRVAVGMPSPEPVTCIGRICNEAHTGKLNSTSLLLEGDRDLANGARINLELTPPYSVFPGQILALEGTNLTGRKLQANKIVSDGIPPSHHLSDNAKATKMIVVAGPYTTSDNLDFEPFLDFVNAVLKEEQPPIVVLMGPFLPTDQAFELVTNEGNAVPVTKETLFTERIACHLEDYVREHAVANTQFILVPSVHDALGRPVYPQPPLQDNIDHKKHLPEHLREGLGLQFIDIAASKKVVHCVPNPCTLNINNDITVGMTSTDILHHLSQAEIHAGMEVGTRLPRLAKHLIQQQSYYPLFPSTDVNIDYDLMEHWRMPQVAPDILLLPSKLAPFCKPATDYTMAINPGLLTKNRAGGTYGILHISSDSQKSITDRIRVDIKRI